MFFFLFSTLVENITIRLFSNYFVIENKSKDSSESAVLQDKLNQANNKVAEFRNQCDKLKKDLKVAHKVRVKHLPLCINGICRSCLILRTFFLTTLFGWVSIDVGVL